MDGAAGSSNKAPQEQQSGVERDTQESGVEGDTRSSKDLTQLLRDLGSLVDEKTEWLKTVDTNIGNIKREDVPAYLRAVAEAQKEVAKNQEFCKQLDGLLELLSQKIKNSE